MDHGGRRPVWVLVNLHLGHTGQDVYGEVWPRFGHSNLHHFPNYCCRLGLVQECLPVVVLEPALDVQERLLQKYPAVQSQVLLRCDGNQQWWLQSMMQQ